MERSLKELLGSPNVSDVARDLIDRANLRSAWAVSLLTAALSVAMTGIVSAGLIRPRGPVTSPGYLLAVAACVAILAASLWLFSYARAFRRTDAFEHSRSARMIGTYAFVLCLGSAIISFYNFRAGRLGLAFLAAMMICFSVFIMRPRVSLGCLTASFGLFCLVLGLNGWLDAGVCLQLWLLWAILAVVSVARFAGYLRLAENEDAARRLSTHDELTGLQNRAALRKRFSGYAGRSIAFVMLDIDDFKYLNDLYGRKKGNLALVSFAQEIARAFPAADHYRFEGDQFLVVLDDPGEERIRACLAALAQAVSSLEVDGQWVALFYSCGYCRGTARDESDVRTALRLSELALSEAKRQGKNRIQGRVLDAQSADVLKRATTHPDADSQIDALTGLPTMTAFRARAARILHEREGYVEGPAVVFFDVENFRAFNRVYGFEGGDAFLRTIARAITETFAGSLVARFGEDHFVVLADTAGLSSRLEQIHETAHGYQRDVAIELKAGVYVPQEGEWDVGVCCDRAKLACESIKRRPDEAWRFYDEELGQAARRQEYVADHIDQAVKEGWIEVFYQPVIRVQTGQLCGMEALARWNDPVLGYLQPADFIETLEQRHLIYKLDVCVIRQVCARLHDLMRQGAPVTPVSLNLSRLDFELCDIKAILEDEVRTQDVPHDMIDVEITESAFVGGSVRIRDEVHALQKLGYHVWMDDFGSGYSSFSALKGYDFDVLKLDRLFLADFDEHPESRIILASVVDMAKQLGIQTLAEGVETDEQLAFLASIGCEKAQGYDFSKPLPYHELMGSLRGRGFTVESGNERGYYDRTGSVNLLGPTHGFGSSKDNPLSSMSPVAVVDLEGENVTLLSINDSFRSLLSSMGIPVFRVVRPDPQGSFESLRGRFVSQLVRARDEDAIGCDYSVGSRIFNVRATCIARTSRRSAFVLQGRDLMGHQRNADELFEAMLVALTGAFDRVDLFAADGSRAENVYLASPRYRSSFVSNSMARSLARYAQADVYEPDRQRFLDLYDPSTLEERLERSDTGRLTGFFRTRNENGSFDWQLYLIVAVRLEGAQYYLSCVCNFDRDFTRQFPRAKSLISYESLWDALVELPPAGVFWKDERRRFIGVNQAFLDYYGLTSVRDVAGRTDEDMGWHIDPDPFCNDEIAVLQRGEKVSGARGLCIRRGEVRNIEATKVPVYEDGRIVGLLGYFQDVTEQMRVEADPEATGSALTGGVLDMRNFQTVLEAYRASFERGGRDFAYVRLSVEDLGGYGRLYGQGFSSKVSAAVVEAVRGLLGNSGVVHHQSGANLVILKQLRSPADLGKLLADVEEALEEIHEVDSRLCEVHALMGACAYSEVHDLGRLRQVAEKRMADEEA